MAKNKKQNNSKWLLLLISVLLGSSLGYYFGYDQGFEKATSQSVANTNQSDSANTTVITSNSSNKEAWMEYKDINQNFSIEAPVSYKYTADKSSSFQLAKGIHIYVDTYSHDPKDCMAQCSEIISDEILNVNGVIMRKIVSRGSSPVWNNYSYNHIEYIVQKENKYYIIEYTQGSDSVDDTKIVDEIARTFKLL